MTPNLNKRVWLLDVDETLTPPRGTIDYDFGHWLCHFAQHRDVRIVTGGDRARIIKQLGRVLVERLTVSYNCLGNSVWMQGLEVERLQFEAPAGFDEFVATQTQQEALPEGCDVHCVRQNGLLAVTLLAADAPAELRQQVETWDARSGARMRLAQAIAQRFPGLEAQVAGTASVDVFPAGKGKSQVADLIAAPVMFFADKTGPGGSDHKLASVLVQRGDSSVVHTVHTWRQTWSWLKRYAAAEEELLQARTRRAMAHDTQHVSL